MVFSVPGQDRSVLTEISGKRIQWTRKVFPFLSHVEIEDTLWTDQPKLQGVTISHSISGSYDQGLLGGQSFKTLLKNLNFSKSPIKFSDPWNPTVFTSNPKGSIAILAEDDIFRQQVMLFFDLKTGRAGFKTESLCLLPNKKYSFKWSIYTSDSSDYWDFINLVRKDWKVIHEISGAFIWFQPEDILAMPLNVLREELQKQHVKVANMFGGWVDRNKPKWIGFGTATLLAEFEHFRGLIKKSILKLKLADPTIRVLIYFDAQRESSQDTLVRYKDSLFSADNQLIEYTDWMNQFNRTWSVYPTLKNTYGRKLLEVLAMIKRLGADGLYWDEIDSLDYSAVRFTAREWDGFSCQLDQDQQVVGQIGYLNLLSQEAKLAYAGLAGEVMANSPPTLRSFQDRNDLHMIEAQHHSDYSSYAHLNTPLGYIGTDDDWEAIVSTVQKGLIPASVRLGYSTSFFAKLFPITPVEIYPGLILGNERIVAARSGTYGWQSNCASVLISQYDSKGQETTFKGKLEHIAFGCRITIVLRKKEAVILTRIPSYSLDSVKNQIFFHPVFL